MTVNTECVLPVWRLNPASKAFVIALTSLTAPSLSRESVCVRIAYPKVCTVEAGPVANVFGDDMVLLTVHATPTETSPAEVRASSLRSSADEDVVEDSTRASLELVVDVYGGNVFMRPAQDGSRNTPVAISFLNWQTYWPPMLYGRAVRVRLPPPLPPPLLSMSSVFNVGSLVAIFNADDWSICSLFGDGGGVIDIDNAGSGSAARFMNVCPMRALVAPDDYDPSTWEAP